MGAPWVTSVAVGKPFEINGVPVTITETSKTHAKFSLDMPEGLVVNFVRDGATKQLKGLHFSPRSA
jgi:hypothetical protein